MADRMRLEVILAAVDKVTGPLKGIVKGSRETSAAIGQAAGALRALEDQQRKLQRLQDATPAMARERNAMRVQQARLDALMASGNATKKQIKDQEAALRKQTAAYDAQRATVLKLRSELNAMGVGNAAQAQQRLASSIATATARLQEQSAKLEAQRKIEERLAAVRTRHEKQMHRIAMGGALAAGSAHVGRRMGGALMQPVTAFADAESATSQLRASMLGADGTVPAEFAKINALAERLGDKLPGTTADFINMMTMLRRQGISAQTILGGTGEAAAYLGVQLKMPVTAAAEFAAKMQDATQTAERDMMGLMDMIQRSYYLGVDSDNMLQGFTKTAAVMPLLGKKGVDAANMLAPMLVMMYQAGMKGEAAGNAIRKVVQLSMDAEKLGKANKLLAGSGVQLQFYGQDGKFAGFDNLFAQLEKLKTITSDVQRIAVMKKLFGDDAETHQVLGTLMEKGQAGYRETEQKMRAQADLTRRVNDELDTLKNRAEAAQGSFTNMLKDLGASIAPELKTVLDRLGELANKTGAWTRENPRLVKGVMLLAAGLAGLLTVAGTLGVVLAAVAGPFLAMRMGLAAWRLGLLGAQAAAVGAAPAMGLLYRAGFMLGRAFVWLKGAGAMLLAGLRTLGVFLVANPIVGAIALLGVAAYLLYTRWAEVKGGAVALWQDIVALKDRFVSAGAALLDGLGQGIANRWAALRETVGGLADSVGAWFRTKLGINSPSRVFMQYGAWISEGAALGMQGGRGAVGAAALALAGAAAVPAMPAMAQPMAFAQRAQGQGAAAGAGAMAMQGGSYQITINTAPGQDAKAIARAVRQELDKRERAGRSRVLSQLSDID